MDIFETSLHRIIIIVIIIIIIIIIVITIACKYFPYIFVMLLTIMALLNTTATCYEQYSFEKYISRKDISRIRF